MPTFTPVVTKSLDAAVLSANGTSANTDASTVSTTTATGQPVPVAVTGVLVHIFGAAATTSTVTVEQSLDGTTWAPALYTVSNVSATGVLLTGPPAPYTRCKLVRVAGTISAYIVASTTVQSPSWKLATSLPTGVLGSVGLIAPVQYAVTGTPLTSNGDITLGWVDQVANKILSGPTTGAAAAPTFRTMVSADIPASISLTTPVLGVASATSVNKVALTAPATGSTLTILEGKTLTANHSLTLAGTDSTTMTFPATSATIARTDAANTFTGTQTVGQLTDSGLTITRVPYASTAGLLIDAAAFTFTTATGALTATIFGGGQKDTIAAKLIDGAIASAPGTLAITKASALGASTVATPTITTHDGYILRILSTTAFAHVLTFGAGTINGGANTTITFTSGAIGDSVTLEAYQGVWYMIGFRGTITIT